MAWAPAYITLADLKKYVRIDVADTTDDADLTVAIEAASRAIDKHTNRQFGKTDAVEERFYTARPDLKRGKWVIAVDDFQTVSGLVVKVGGVTTTEFTKEPVNAAGKGRPWTRIVIDPKATVKPRGDEFEVGVTIVWGWTAFPVPVTEAARLQGSRFFSRRKSPYGIAGSPDQGSELRLLSRLDPDVMVSLGSYIRPRRFG